MDQQQVEPEVAESPYTKVMRVIGAKWSSGIVLEINKGNMRFGTIMKSLPGITKKSLSRELRKLEEFKIVVRNVETSNVQQIRYSLTKAGTELVPQIEAIYKWAEKHYN